MDGFKCLTLLTLLTKLPIVLLVVSFREITKAEAIDIKSVAASITKSSSSSNSSTVSMAIPLQTLLAPIPARIRAKYIRFAKSFVLLSKEGGRKKKDVVDQPTPTRAHYPPLK